MPVGSVSVPAPVFTMSVYLPAPSAASTTAVNVVSAVMFKVNAAPER